MWKQIRSIGHERIEKLFKLAEKVFHENPNLSNRYVELARKISMRARIRIPLKWRRRFCHRCFSFLVVGVNCHIRIKSRRVSHIVVTCHVCGNVMRYIIKKDKEEKYL
ncbi:MAG: ribonuclease P [Candidatus Methanomethylicia archaeon]|nr:ribonuclease P [Candidatus Methanomethylicia archaeon]MCX8169303.1 ribonuclease P [Candidatus Methanomethylicia archaeon]MDW7988914.1 ribonuclease P [Nitrososphaerota archaeon]